MTPNGQGIWNVSDVASREPGLARRVSRAIEAAMRDLTASGPSRVVSPINIEIADGDFSGKVMVTMAFGERRAGFGVYENESDAELTVQVASGLQDAFIEESRSASPLCPGHQHPLAARVRDDAIWECPKKPDYWSCMIGQYPEAVTKAENHHNPRRATTTNES